MFLECRDRWLAVGSPAGDQVVGSLGPGGVFEGEACGLKAGGDDLAAFEDEFGLRSHQEGADFEHPGGGGKADGGAPGLAELAHEVAVGERVGRGKVDGPFKIFAGNQEFDGAGEVGVVDPGDELVARAGGASESEANEGEEDVEDAAGVGAEGHGTAEGDAAGVGELVFEEGRLPVFGHFDGEVPGVGCAGFVAAEFAAKFAGEVVLGTVQGVAVDGGGGGVHPDFGRMFEFLQDMAEQAGGEDAGVVNLATVFDVVAAVDAAASEVEEEVGLVQVLGPGAGGEAVPEVSLPGGVLGGAAEDDDLVTLGVEVPGEDLSDLSGAAGDDDFHWVISKIVRA